MPDIPILQGNHFFKETPRFPPKESKNNPKIIKITIGRFIIFALLSY